MSLRYKRQLWAAEQLITSYSIEEPLLVRLKKYFQANKKAGKRDRYIIQHLVYTYFRVAAFFDRNQTFNEIIAKANALLPSGIEELDHFLLQELNEQTDMETSAVYRNQHSFLNHFISNTNRSPLSSILSHLSTQIDKNQYAANLLSEQDVWIRVRSEHKAFVEDEFVQSGLMSERKCKNDLAWCFAPKKSLTQTLSYSKGFFEIQDIQSQNVFENLPKELGNGTWLDCCCGSGGKSILFLQLFPKVQLFASDIRTSILKNFDLRTHRSQTPIVRSFVHDFTQSTIPKMISLESLSGIIADVPCTGSGTWARSPEQMYFFDESSITEYAKRSFNIVSNASKLLRSGGVLVFITCSVFKKENEDQVADLCERLNFRIHSSNYLIGYLNRSDTLYTAILIKK
ncbi:MAG TPA: hypothetical protein PKH65_05640 [Bacteroidia bacterium]|nr:hypothetical protein [Bacteroidia bacterium]